MHRSLRALKQQWFNVILHHQAEPMMGLIRVSGEGGGGGGGVTNTTAEFILMQLEA